MKLPLSHPLSWAAFALSLGRITTAMLPSFHDKIRLMTMDSGFNICYETPSKNDWYCEFSKQIIKPRVHYVLPMCLLCVHDSRQTL